MGDVSKYFSKYELCCHCGCNLFNVQPELLAFLDYLRNLVGHPVFVSSGSRCAEHDLNIYLEILRRKFERGSFTKEEYRELLLAERMKKRTSSHIKGLALDIKVNSSQERYEYLRIILRYPGIHISRIGIASDFIHIDIDLDKIPEVIWRY